MCKSKMAAFGARYGTCAMDPGLSPKLSSNSMSSLKIVPVLPGLSGLVKASRLKRLLHQSKCPGADPGIPEGGRRCFRVPKRQVVVNLNLNLNMFIGQV